MNTMELTEEMAVKRWAVPAWLKVAAYVGLGAMVWKGATITYEEAKKALVQAKYAYVAKVVADELDGKGFSLSTDMRDNKKHQFGDLTPAQMSLAIWALSGELQQCEYLRSQINSMTTGIDVVRASK